MLYCIFGGVGEFAIRRVLRNDSSSPSSRTHLNTLHRQQGTKEQDYFCDDCTACTVSRASSWYVIFTPHVYLLGKINTR